MKIKKTEIIGLLDYILLTLVIIMSGTMYAQVDLNFIPVNLFQIATLVLAVVISIFRIKQLSNRFALWMTLVFLSFITYSVCNMDYFKEGLRYVYLPLLAFSVYAYAVWESNEIISIYKKLINITIVLSVLSLFFYFTGSILTIIKPTNYYSLAWSFLNSVPSYYNLHFETMTIGNVLGMKVIKNSGIYPESPMFTFLLCFALGIQTNVLENNIKKSLILIITIITTGTTTGFLVLLIIYILKILSNKTRNKSRFVIKMLLAIPVFILGTLISFSLIIEKMTTASYGTRTGHFFSAIEAFIRSGFLGVGITNHDGFLQYTSAQQGPSVGLPVLFAEAGIGLLLLFIYVLYKNIKNHRLNALVAIFLILSMMTYVVFQMRFWLFFVLVFSDTLFSRKTFRNCR